MTENFLSSNIFSTLITISDNHFENQFNNIGQDINAAKAFGKGCLVKLIHRSLIKF